jgi:hypothetical protein
MNECLFGCHVNIFLAMLDTYARCLLFGLLVGLGIKFPILGARKYFLNTESKYLRINVFDSSTLFRHRFLFPYGKS